MSKSNGRLARGGQFPYRDLRIALRMWAHVAHVEAGAYSALIDGAQRRRYYGRENDLQCWGRARELAFQWKHAWSLLATCEELDVEGLLTLIDGCAAGIPPPADVVVPLIRSGPPPAAPLPPIVQELEPHEVKLGRGVVGDAGGAHYQEDVRSASAERAPLPEPPPTDI